MLRYETDASFLSISEIQKLEAKSGTIESEKLLSLLYPKFSFKVESKKHLSFEYAKNDRVFTFLMWLFQATNHIFRTNPLIELFVG